MASLSPPVSLIRHDAAACRGRHSRALAKTSTVPTTAPAIGARVSLSTTTPATVRPGSTAGACARAALGAPHSHTPITHPTTIRRITTLSLKLPGMRTADVDDAVVGLAVRSDHVRAVDRDPVCRGDPHALALNRLCRGQLDHIGRHALSPNDVEGQDLPQLRNVLEQSLDGASRQLGEGAIGGVEHGERPRV